MNTATIASSLTGMSSGLAPQDQTSAQSAQSIWRLLVRVGSIVRCVGAWDLVGMILKKTYRSPYSQTYTVLVGSHTYPFQGDQLEVISESW